MVLIVAFQAEVTRLIQLYIVGVFVSFTLSQTGMLRHWNRLLRTETDPAVRRRMLRARAINGFGVVMTGVVLVIVLITKFLLGAWIAIAAMAVIYVLMLGIQRHYDRVAPRAGTGETDAVLPARNHAIVLVSKVHLPTLRAVAYAQATRPDTLTALTVNVDDADTRAAGGVGAAGHPGAADRHRLAVPGDHPADHRLREVAAHDAPARRGHRLHPRVRRRPLVGAPAAQPERAAAQGPAAVRAGRDGDQRAVAAAVVGADQDARPETPPGSSAAATSPRPSEARTPAAKS